MSGHGLLVGNDVVDLSDPRMHAKHDDERFVRRVLADEEREAVAASGEPGRFLWALWAAKEAGFKVASKRRHTVPPFVHAAFVVRLAEGGGDAWMGVVHYEELELPVTVYRRPGVLHAVAQHRQASADPRAMIGLSLERLDRAGAPWDGPLDVVRARLTEAEARAVHSAPSAAVRVGAKQEVARVLGAEESRVEIVCPEGPVGRTPPEVHLDGRAADADVSLSHHGGWIAWAWAGLPPAPV